MNDYEIPGNDTATVIYVTEGGKIDRNATIGMTYNELKSIYNFAGAEFTGGTFGATAYVYINGIKWGIEFNLSQQDKERLGVANGIPLENLGKIYDLSSINPKSDLGYYIQSIQ